MVKTYMTLKCSFNNLIDYDNRVVLVLVRAVVVVAVVPSTLKILRYTHVCVSDSRH